MRRLILLLAVIGCAQQGFPPGGPEDKNPPKLLGVRPESGAVNVRPHEVEFQFDEVINERPQGAATLDQLVLISPTDGATHVGWHRARITVRGRRDFKPNTTYTVTLLPGIGDLRGNARRDPTAIVFATGPVLASSRLTGIAFDWVAAHPLSSGLVYAVSRPDSTVYVAHADTAGRFTLANLPPGVYTVQAIGDANNNRVLDPREMWDSVRVTLRDTARVELLAFVHDTIGPRLAHVDVKDSLTLRATFDKPIDPALPLDTAHFILRASDSTVVPIRRVEMGRAYDQRITDSITKSDTTKKPPRDTSVRVPPPGRRAPDTTHAPPPPAPSRPIPSIDVVLTLGRPLTPKSSYRLEATDIRNLLRIVASSGRTFTVSAAAPPASPRDTTRRPPPPSRPPRRAP